MRYLILIGSSLLVLSSCSKDDDDHTYDPNDTIAPTISVNSPTEGQSFTSGTDISFAGRITDDKGLYRGTVRITKNSDGSVVKEQVYEIHGFLSYDFNVSQAITVSASTAYTVTVRFEDHGSNASSKTVGFLVQP